MIEQVLLAADFSFEHSEVFLVSLLLASLLPSCRSHLLQRLQTILVENFGVTEAHVEAQELSTQQPQLVFDVLDLDDAVVLVNPPLQLHNLAL